MGGTILMPDVYCWSSQSGADDVRWEKVEHIKRSLTPGTYAVPAKRVAAKLFTYMLERDHATERWGTGSSSKSKAGEESERER
jgi:Anti-sigma-28 factor, FlgM